MATIVTRSGKGSPLTNNEVDANFNNLNTDKLELGGGTLTGNLNFGDNVKAQFGASNDLQIYHDGSASWIKEAGSGSLILTGNGGDISLFDASNSAYMVRANTGSDVQISHAGSLKLATTSTGIDVTGRTTTDNATVGSGTASTYVDLTVNGASTSNYGPIIELQSAGTAFGKISNVGRIQGGTSTNMFVTTASTNSLVLGTNNTPNVTIANGGAATFTGAVTANAGVVVDNITIDGTEIDSSSSLLLDIAGNLTINVDGTTVTLADDSIKFWSVLQ